MMGKKGYVSTRQSERAPLHPEKWCRDGKLSQTVEFVAAFQRDTKNNL